MGPLVTQEHQEKVLGYIEIGRKEGRLLVGGGTPEDAALSRGCFVEPTIFADVDNRARIAQEEIFGPVLVVIPFDDEAEAVRIANDTPYGLAGAVWTRDVFRGIRVLKQMRAGILWLNTYHPTYNEAPWGGYKQSGFGRELGPYGLEHYLETKQINMNLTEAPHWLVLTWTSIRSRLRIAAIHLDRPGATVRDQHGPRSSGRQARGAEPASATLHPIFVERASGATMTDVDGNTFIDFTGGIGVMNVGHADPAVTRRSPSRRRASRTSASR